jgi:hypothetical protein
MKGETYKRCGCRDPQTGRQLGRNCPELLSRSLKRRHGSWFFDTRIDTTGGAGQRLKRGGYLTEKAASEALDHVRALVRLGRDDHAMQCRIGDLIFERSKRGGQLPDAVEVRRRLGAGLDLAASAPTMREYFGEWLAGKRKIKPSVERSYRQHIDNWLIPVLGDIPVDRLRAEHIAGMFDLIDERNAIITEARAEGRTPHLPGDVRKRPKVVPSTASLRRCGTR